MKDVILPSPAGDEATRIFDNTQSRELWRQLRDGELDSGEVEAFLQHKPPFGDRRKIAFRLEKLIKVPPLVHGISWLKSVVRNRKFRFTQSFNATSVYNFASTRDTPQTFLAVCNFLANTTDQEIAWTAGENGITIQQLFWVLNGKFIRKGEPYLCYVDYHGQAWFAIYFSLEEDGRYLLWARNVGKAISQSTHLNNAGTNVLRSSLIQPQI